MVFDWSDGIDVSTINRHIAEHHLHDDNTKHTGRPHECADFYHDEGYTILTIDNGTNRDSLWPPTEWSEMDHLDNWDEDWEDRDGEEDYDPDLLFVRGVEFSADSIHTNGYFITDEVDEPSAGEGNWYDMVAALDDEGALVGVAHPSRYHRGENWHPRTCGAGDDSIEDRIDEWYDAYSDFDNCKFFEVPNKNSGTGSGVILGKADHILWDRMLTRLLLTEGVAEKNNIYGWGNDDTDHLRVGSNVDTRRNIVLTDEHSTPGVKNAYLSGQFFWAERRRFSLGNETEFPTIDDVEVDESAETITISASNYSEIRWYSMGVVVATGDTFDWSSGRVGPYVRAEVWTNPSAVVGTQPWLFNPYRLGAFDQDDLVVLGGIDTTASETTIDEEGRLLVEGDLDTTKEQTRFAAGDLHVDGGLDTTGGDL